MKRHPTHETVAGTRYLALRALANDTGLTTAEMLQIYALEGFLVRLARSPYRNRLVLKGGMLLAALDERRPTRDIDLLALRTPRTVEAVRDLVIHIVREPEEDGLRFDLADVSAETIRETDAYPGIRVTLRATLATARLVFHVDVNVGDVLWPGPTTVEVPRLLGPETITLAGYPLPMVFAEKIATALQRGTANTRWRDFADVVRLARRHSLDGSELQCTVAEVAGPRVWIRRS